jgi:hypothetical protein
MRAVTAPESRFEHAMIVLAAREGRESGRAGHFREREALAVVA